MGGAPVITVYTAGVFDLLHQGHLNVLHASRAMGGRLVVGVVSDAGCEAYKGRRPVQDEATRLEIIRALRVVDEVHLQPTTDPTPILEVVRPQIMTHGDDWAQLREGHGTLDRLGITFALVPYTPGISSSVLRERMVAA